MGSERTPGTLEAAALAWVATLGQLSPRRTLLSQDVIRLARAADEATSGSGVASASKEMKQTMEALRAGRSVPTPAPAPEPPPEPVKLSRADEVANARQRRQARAAKRAKQA